MALLLELTPDEERRVDQAKRQGLDVVAMLKSVIAVLPAPADTNVDRTEELLAQWEAEDATDDPELIAEAERDLVEFKANMNANRSLTGERPVYK